MDEKQLQLLWDLHAKNGGFQSFGEFKTLMSDSNARKVYFESANPDLGFGNYQEFESTLGVKKKVSPLPSGVAGPEVEEVALAPSFEQSLQESTLSQNGSVLPEYNIQEPGVIEPVEPSFTPIAPHVDPFGIGETVAKQIYQGLGDQTPKAFIQASEAAISQLQAANIDEYIKRNKSVDFQRYVRGRDPKFVGDGSLLDQAKGMITPFDMDEFMPKYRDQFIQDAGLGEIQKKIDAKRPEIIQRRLEVERYAQQQNKESEETLRGITQSYKEIRGPGDLARYATNMATQGLWQIPLVLATKGMSGLAMESSEVYDNQLEQIVKLHNDKNPKDQIDREEAIKRNLDKPAEGQFYAIAAAGMDYASAGGLLSLVKGGGSNFVKNALAVTTETLTEPTQGMLEEMGGVAGAGGDVGKAFQDAWTTNLTRRLDEAAGGFFGSGAVTVASNAVDKLKSNGKQNPKVSPEVKTEAAGDQATQESVRPVEEVKGEPIIPKEDEKLKEPVGEVKPEGVQSSAEDVAQEEVPVQGDKEIKVGSPLTDNGEVGLTIKNTVGDEFKITEVISKEGAESIYKIEDKEGNEYKINAQMADMTVIKDKPETAQVKTAGIKPQEDGQKIDQTEEIISPAPQGEADVSPTGKNKTVKEKDAIQKWLDQSDDHSDYVSFDWDGDVLEIFKGRDSAPVEMDMAELEQEGVFDKGEDGSPGSKWVKQIETRGAKEPKPTVLDDAKQLRPKAELQSELNGMRKTLAQWKKQGKDKYDPDSYKALEEQIGKWARAIGTNLTGMAGEEIEQAIMPEKEFSKKASGYFETKPFTSFEGEQSVIAKKNSITAQLSIGNGEKNNPDFNKIYVARIDSGNPSKGDGSLFMDDLKKLANEIGSDGIFGFPENQRSKAFFTKNGFEERKDGMFYYDIPKGNKNKVDTRTPKEIDNAKIDALVESGDLKRDGKKVTALTEKGAEEAIKIKKELEEASKPKEEKSRIREIADASEGRIIIGSIPKSEQKKSDVIRGEIKQLFGELDDLIGPSIRKQMVGEQEQDRLNKIAAVGSKIVGKYVELGVTRFAEIAKEIYKEYGEKALRDYFSAMKEGYARYIMAAENIENFDDFYKVKSYKEQELIDSFKPKGDELRTISNTDGGDARQVSGGDVTSKTGKPVSEKPVERLPEQADTVSPKEPGRTGRVGKKRTGSDGDSDITTPGTGLRTDGGEQIADESKPSKPDTKKPVPVENQNHVIEDSDSIVPSGEIAKIKANIEAIKLVQLLDKEKRNATPEEKKILAKYVGWGGLAPVLDRSKARNAWDDNWLKKYEKYYKEIDELLTDDEFQNAINSTINAHYTDRRVIGALWDIAKRLGFKGGNVLEPSAGVGHFFGLMPQELAQNSNLKAYELDKITGQILSKLYPQAQVRITGYEEAVESNNSQDLIITNVPFGASAPFDSRYQELSKFSLHNYFMAKGIQQLKPGGLGIFITSMSSMDNPGASTKFREWTNNDGNADFVGAIRLPNNMFSENAGTEVTTDILIYKKRTSEHPSDLNQVYRNVVPIKQTKDSEGNQVDIVVNEYYASNPDMMLGDMMLAHEAGSGGLYRADVQTMKAPAGQDTLALLQDRIKSLPEDIFGAEKTQVTEASEKAEATDKDGTFKESNGKIFMVENGELIPQSWANETITLNSKSYKKSDVIKDYLGVKKAITDLVNAEHSELKDDELGKQREALNKSFDSFVKKYGNFARNKKLDFLEDDSDHNVVFALENIKKESILNEKGNIRTTYRIDKSDIFTKRVNYPYSEPTKAQDIGDAMNISLSYRGKIDLPYVGKLINLSEAEARDQLLTSKLAFENPKSGLLEDADSYLSGFVRTKLREAEEEAKVNPDFERNAKELKKVVPKDIPSSMIEFKLGSTWLPNKYIEDWVKSTLGVESKISYNDKTGSWIVRNMRGVHDGRNQTAYATKDFTAMELIEKDLNLRQPEVSYTVKSAEGTRTVKDAEATAAAQAKMQELADMFYNNLKSNKAAMDEIEVVYNNIYNDFIEKKYSLPTFTHYPGANKSITLRLHQRRPIARALSDSVLLAHQVGTGKTFTLITIAMEMRRLNTAKKPMVVVQNATLEQFAASFLTLYPSAKILVPTKQQMDANNRQKLFNRIAYNDWDAVIIPQSFLDFIPDDPVRERAILNEQLAELESALGEAESEGDRGAMSELKRIIKGLEKQLEETDQPKKGRKVKDQAKVNLAAEKAQKKQASRRMDDVFNFESMGVDALLVDEAHAYKKLGFLSKMSRIKGIDIGRSKRSFGLFMKARWVQEKNKGKNIVLATGTPITNTMAEVWTMMRYTSPDILKKYRISTFDEFASTFGQVEPSLEFTASGSFKIVERFKSYINAPELLTAFRSKTDVVLTEDVPEFKESNAIPKLKEQPDGKRGFTNVIIPQTEALAQMMETFKQILKAWEKLSGKEKKAQRHIPLLVFNRAKQAAIDLRLINATNADDPGSKTNKVVKEAKRIYDETSPYNGTQLIFSDMYQSPEVKDEFLDEDRTVRNPNFNGKRFNLYEDIKSKLVKVGIPADQIAVIQDYEGERRNVLFTKINAGEVRILLGSTEKMGVGVNVQERLAALHHIDAPPRPMDFEQRNGRIIRQGNSHAEMGKPVEVLTFGVEKTLDATAYQRLAIKQKFINQMMKAEGIDRDMKDDADEDSASDLTFDQMMSELSGSQFAMLHMQRSYELRKLRTAKNNYERSIIDFNSQIKHDKRLIEAYKLTADRYKPMQREFKELFPEDKVTSLTFKMGFTDDAITYKEKFSEPLQKLLDNKFSALEMRQHESEHTYSITVNDGVPISITFYKKFSIQSGTYNFNATYKIHSKESDASIRTIGKVETGQGLLTSINSTIHKFTQEGWNGDTDINDIPEKIKQKERDIESVEKMLGKPFDKNEKLTSLEKEVEDLEKKMQEETKDKEPEPPKDEPPTKSIEEQTVEFSERSSSTYEDFKGAMATMFPIPVQGKVKKEPSNKKLYDYLAKKAVTQKEMDDILDESIKAIRPEVEERIKEATKPVDVTNVSKWKDFWDFITGFRSHHRYLSEKQFPREANLLREFEGRRGYASTQAHVYVKGLYEPLTKQQQTILSRMIFLSDLLESIDKGLSMQALDGSYSFGYASKEEIEHDLKKYESMASADPAIQQSFDKRNEMQKTIEGMLVSEGLLKSADIESYYHRRVMANKNDDFNKSIILGKELGPSKKNWQRMRTGTRGLDYSTNVIETEFKVMAEAIYEIEKQAILKDLMAPYEKQLKGIVKEFNDQFNDEFGQLEKQYGKASQEVEIKKDTRYALKKRYIIEHLPEGYVFWRPSDENTLFWTKTVTQQVIDKTMGRAQELDETGAGTMVDIVDELINDIDTKLAVGAKRKQYMVPKVLAEQLEYMATNAHIEPLGKVYNSITGEIKRLVLASPSRILKYALNNSGGDLDKAIATDVKILKYAKHAFSELWKFAQYGEANQEILEAIKGNVIDSGYEIQELSSLSEQNWNTYIFDRTGGPTVEDLVGAKKWGAETALMAARKPGEIYERYMDVAWKYLRFRENVLRYSAYLLAKEYNQQGKTFYWASDKKKIDAITDTRQKLSKLSREVFGDYGNLSFSGQQIRRAAIPFYSWMELNMRGQIQLMKNAFSPDVQKSVGSSVLRRGVPLVAWRMARAWGAMFAFTAAVEMWNHLIFPLWGEDDDDEDKNIAGKLRRSKLRGMQVLLYTNPDGTVVALPIVGAFYDFLDFFGIPGAADDIAEIFLGNTPMQSAARAGKQIAIAPANKVFLGINPLIKLSFEGATGQTYFPDPQSPQPIRDYGEWLANYATIKDEYNYLFTDKPKPQSYVERKLTNSLVLREYDPDMLAYYQAKNLIERVTGAKGGGFKAPSNPQDVAKKQALYYWSLAMRYGNTEEGNKQLTKYVENGGTSQDLMSSIKSANPFNSLKKEPRLGEPISEFDDFLGRVSDDDYKPQTWAIKQFSNDEIKVFKDAMKYYNRMYNPPKK